MESNKLSDEDWSIISSSSDADEDHSISNSVTSVKIESDNDSSYLGDKSISSVATLKLPRMSSSSSKGYINDKNQESNTSKSPKVIQNIKFYESLSRLNNSIKKTSFDFYENIAKLKLQQFNNYIHNDDVDDDLKVCVKGDLTPEDNTIETTDNSQPSDRACSLLKSFKDNFLHPFSNLITCLENNSEYLLYYFIAIAVTLGSSTFLYCRYSNYFFPVKETEKISFTSLYAQRLYGIWDKIIYDTKEPTPHLFGIYKTYDKAKSFKALRIYNDLKCKWLDVRWSQAKSLADVYFLKATGWVQNIRYQEFHNCMKSVLSLSHVFYLEFKNSFKEKYGQLNFAEILFLTKNSLKESLRRISIFMNQFHIQAANSLIKDLSQGVSENLLTLKYNIDSIAILVFQTGCDLKKSAIGLFY